jgi:hypothetical protein
MFMLFWKRRSIPSYSLQDTKKNKGGKESSLWESFVDDGREENETDVFDAKGKDMPLRSERF